MLRSIARCHEVAMYPVTLNVKGRRCLVVGGGWGALRVSEAAASAGVWVNVADDPALCTFHLPARVRRGSLQLSIASGGESPFVVRRLRAFLERRFGPEWTAWIEGAGRFRGSGRAPRPPPGGVGGAGPGAAGLLTLRGRQRLMSAEAVVYDRLAATALPCDLPANVGLHCVGKEAGHHPVPQEEINALLVRLAREGKRVVRLKGGDPYVFGRGGEEAEALAAAGVRFEVVPGVTSGIAVPAYAGVPPTHRHEAVRVTLLTAHESKKEDGTQVRWDLLAADPHSTLVGYMGVTSLPQGVERPISAGVESLPPAPPSSARE